jgi:hypothetical protein
MLRAEKAGAVSGCDDRVDQEDWNIEVAYGQLRTSWVMASEPLVHFPLYRQRLLQNQLSVAHDWECCPALFLLVYLRYGVLLKHGVLDSELAECQERGPSR